MYISIEITHFHGSKLAPNYRFCHCNYYEQIEGEPMTARELDLETARKLQWELLLAGGERSYHSNIFEPGIFSSEVKYYSRE